MGSLPTTQPAAWGATHNPWDLDRTPGGSSGGSAAAVAAGMVAFANASDGGGSIRIPASACGLVGLKPSQGRISVGPARAEVGLGVEHCVSRTVRDSAVLLDATRGPGIGDTVIAAVPDRPYADEVGADPGRLRIGLLDAHPLGGFLHDDCVEAVRSAAADAGGARPRRRAGLAGGARRRVRVGDGSWPCGRRRWRWPPPGSAPRWGGSWARTTWSRSTGSRSQYAKQLSAVDLATAQAASYAFRREVQQWWTEGWDLLLTPTLGEPPPLLSEFAPVDGDPSAQMRRAGRFCPFTPAFNMSGQPAISLPLHWNADGLPIGVQLVAAYGREDVLIRVASQLEQSNPWKDKHPSE